MRRESCQAGTGHSSLNPDESPQTAHDVTDLLRAWSAGDTAALDHLMPLVTDELRRLAQAYIGRQGPGHTLQPTALVNELYLRLVGRSDDRWPDRSRFFAFAAKTMRNILVDHARAHRAAKRGAGAPKIALDEVRDGRREPVVDLIALDEALNALAALDERQSRIVELRAFSGLSLKETAACLSVSEATVSRDWALAKAWLYRQLTFDPPS